MRLRFLCYLLILISTQLANATPLETTPDTKFDVKQANTQFDQINLKLSVENLNLSDLGTAIDTLSELNSRAEHCVDTAQKKINNLNELVAQNNVLSNQTKQSVDRLYLSNQIKKLESHQADCRLFSIRAIETIDAYKKASSQLVKKVAFTREQSLWNILTTTVQSPVAVIITPLFENMQFDAFPSFKSALWMISISFLFSFLLLFHLQKRQISLYKIRKNPLTFYHMILLTTTISSGMLLCYLWDQFCSTPLDSTTFQINAIVFAYLLAHIAIIFAFLQPKVKGYFLLHRMSYQYFRQLFFVVISMGALGFIGALITAQFKMDEISIQLGESLYLFSLLIFSLYFVVRFGRIHRQVPWVQRYRPFIRTATFIWCISCAILDIQGYQLLAMHLAFSGILIFTLILITLSITHGIHYSYMQLYHSPRLKAWIIRYVGYTSDQLFIECLILKTILQIFAVAIGIYLIGISMDFTSFYIESGFSKLLNGIHVGEFIINPTRILFGLLMFSVLFLVFRAIATAIIRHNQLDKEEEETQVALASIATYAGFLLAVIAGLIIAGFNFTGLAIVAGALSVGIGLGLQSIVNNFVSGLILLIEKPIRPGDRINVDGAEGFVKKIRIRSTQILTPSREDIIIPNSDLITRQVTNYMFSDKYCLVTCEVGVAYGSNIQLVRDTLLNIANLHEDVVKTGRMKPTVLFQSFGDNNLIFQLICLIKDVNKKMTVRSDLNFAIEEAFRLHQINMAFPQRDIRVTWPETPPLPIK
jgi:potassium efflux system protein